MSKINLKDIKSPNTKIKYACAKQAIAISTDNPSELYSDFDFFVTLLENPNNIFKWTALQVIGNLSKVDSKNKVDKLLPRIIGFLKSKEMITANNAILALSEIAYNKPGYSNKVIKELLKIERYSFDTIECRNIVIGKTLLAFGRLKTKIKDNKEVMLYIEKQTSNPRNATRKKAQELLKKVSKVEN